MLLMVEKGIRREYETAPSFLNNRKLAVVSN